jgi:hypothetical protein
VDNQQQHPITPPPELVQQWKSSARRLDLVVARAAQWGADQELEACCEWLVRNYNYPEAGNPLRATRRPKPPSLKEQALEELDGIAAVFRISHGGDIVCDKIRRALEALPE